MYMPFKHNKRVPMAANFFTWKYLDAGYNLNVALRDYDILEKVNREFHELYRFDTYSDMGGRNQIRVSDALGAKFHYVDESGEFVVADDRELIKDGEYPEYMADPLAFGWTKMFPRYVKPGLTLAELGEAMQEFMAYTQYTMKMNDVLLNEMGALCTLPMTSMVMTPLESLFNGNRGIKATASDIRRNKEGLKEVMDFIWDAQCEPALQAGLVVDPTPYVAPIATVFLAHSILSVKQFEELYWPYLKRIIDAAVAASRRIYIFSEAEMLRFADFFDDVPKGTMMIQVEQDDIFAVRKRLPNIVLAGGMPTHLLGHATAQECVDYAKHLIDELGEGYVFSQDKMMSYRNDATRENLLAVSDFVLNYAY